MSRKPWPKDCIPLFCEPSESVDVRRADNINFGVCSDCGTAITYDSMTFAQATITGALTGGRRPKLFCMRCLPEYDFAEVDILVDYSGGIEVREYFRNPDAKP